MVDADHPGTHSCQHGLRKTDALVKLHVGFNKLSCCRDTSSVMKLKVSRQPVKISNVGVAFDLGR